MNPPQPFQFLFDSGNQHSSRRSNRSGAPLPRRQVLLSGITGGLGAAAGNRLHASMAGLSNPQNDSAAVPSRARSLIVIFLTGAASHHDTFDMKPFAPAEIRGEFQPISTSVPGLQICEHLPRLAARADKYSLIRTLSHGDNNHLMSTHHVLTGHQQPGGFFDKVASRDDWPCYSAACEFLRPRSDGIPAGVNLPTFLMSSPLTWPGQHAGFLGSKYDPWQIVGNPARDDFRVESLTLANGLNTERLDQRRSLLNQLNGQQNLGTLSGSTARMSEDQRLAFSMLTSSGLASAFELHREPQAIRDRYGRNIDGQSLLLARRLVQSGVRIVQVNIGPVQNWDNHAAIFQTLKGRLLPPLDLGVSALLDDLDE